ncbi:hypothetical protein HDC94_000410 [Leifsonia sp. AK011]|uniref:hypothetical protein n=1 Tax=Leifsonia sp. AK011 TaxID=2723075 RepID=UPI0015C95C85|nr:hypothetical protein [Leifsonia sp. AK011]NYF09254.1 hypothetical protein [Leifsonia sp. AK011]
MNTLRTFAAAAIVVSAVFSLSACSPNTPVIAPVTVEANDLQGTNVDLVVGQVLNINTGDLAVDSYTAEIADGAILEFTQGREDGSAVFNPGFTAKAVGETEVTMTNEQGGIQPLEFTVTVTE